MRLSLTDLRGRARSPVGQKAIRYSLVSVVTVLVSQTTLFALFALAHWRASSANIVACIAGGIPSYYLNRKWVWGKGGRSHLVKEVLPFWVLGFAGLALSTLAADLAESRAAGVTASRLGQALIVNATVIAAFGVIWVVKFVMFEKLLFVKRDGDEDTQVDSPLADELAV